ncbi:MAG TPA: hypothetical protein VNJ07_04295, partial [Chitinophagales bacterium]|nr:hypothetical protein [Chitinophagales bacterium]
MSTSPFSAADYDNDGYDVFHCGYKESEESRDKQILELQRMPLSPDNYLTEAYLPFNPKSIFLSLPKINNHKTQLSVMKRLFPLLLLSGITTFVFAQSTTSVSMKKDACFQDGYRSAQPAPAAKTHLYAKQQLQRP